MLRCTHTHDARPITVHFCAQILQSYLDITRKKICERQVPSSTRSGAMQNALIGAIQASNNDTIKIVQRGCLPGLNSGNLRADTSTLMTKSRRIRCLLKEFSSLPSLLISLTMRQEIPQDIRLQAHGKTSAAQRTAARTFRIQAKD